MHYHCLGRSTQQVKAEFGEKGDLGIVAEVCFCVLGCFKMQGKICKLF